MNHTAFYTAIKTRLEADTGTGGLFKTGAALVTAVYCELAVPDLSASYPYLYVDIAGFSIEDGFSHDMHVVRFRVHTYAQTAGGQGVPDAICQRVMGNGSNSPTYGLHRHSLTLASGDWSATKCQWVDRQFDNDEDYFHYIDVFEVRVYRAVS